MSEPLTVQSIPTDRAIMTLLAINERKSMEEIAAILGLSLGMVQRYFRFLKKTEFIQADMGKSGKKIVDRSTRLTEEGKKALRLYGHTV